MKILKLVFRAGLLSFFLSYASVLLFLMFGPVFFEGELAIDHSRKWTTILTVIVFVPIVLILLKRSRKLDQKK